MFTTSLFSLRRKLLAAPNPRFFSPAEILKLMVPFSITNYLNYDVALMHLVSQGMSKCRVPIAQSANPDLRRGHMATRLVCFTNCRAKIYLITVLFVHLFVWLFISVTYSYLVLTHHIVVTLLPIEVICYACTFISMCVRERGDLIRCFANLWWLELAHSERAGEMPGWRLVRTTREMHDWRTVRGHWRKAWLTPIKENWRCMAGV